MNHPLLTASPRPILLAALLQTTSMAVLAQTNDCANIDTSPRGEPFALFHDSGGHVLTRRARGLV